MQDRLIEVLFEHQLRLLLAVYDPDRVFRWTANNCTLFGLNIKLIQFAVVTILNNPYRKISDCDKEAIAICRHYGMSPRLIIDTLSLSDKHTYLVYNYKSRPGKILPAEHTSEIREELRAYLNQCHMLKEIL